MAAYKRTDKKGSWYITFYFRNQKIKIMNWKKINGINKTFDSKAEAMQAESKYKLILENPTSEITLYSLFDEYIKNTKGQLKESSLKHYNVFKTNYLALIPNKKIMDITIKDIQTWKNKLFDRSISSSVINRHKNILLQLLKYGNQMYDLQGRLQIPLLESHKDNAPIVESKLKYIPPKDFELLLKPYEGLLDIGNNLYYYTIFKILYNTGLRIGELAALTLDDITDTYININKDYIRINGRDIIQAAKSKNSIRKVYLDTNTKEILCKYLEVYKPVDIVFKLESKYLTQQRIREVLKELGSVTGLDQTYELKVHNLRHSHASNLRALGYDELLISKRLGNTPRVALETYIHNKDDELQEIAKKLENIEK